MAGDTAHWQSSRSDPGTNNSSARFYDKPVAAGCGWLEAECCNRGFDVCNRDVNSLDRIAAGGADSQRVSFSVERYSERWSIGYS